MADNVTLPGAGVVIAADDLAGVFHQYAKMEFGEDGEAVPVSLASPLPIAPSATNFIFSALGQNASVTQLASSATFTGTIEGTYSQQAISILLTTDQNGTLTINQFIDETGIFKTNSWVYKVFAGVPFSQALTVNGNYAQVVFQNTGPGTTTTLNLNTAFGTLPSVNDAGNSQVAVYDNARASLFNSSTTNIAASGNFTGLAEEITDYASIVVSIFSSHASATDGLSIQQSSNGSNWDLGDTYSVPATTGKVFTVPVQAKFFRVVYTNSGTLTTSFRLQTIYNKNAKSSSSIRPQDARSNDNDTTEVVSYNALFNGVSWDRARGTIAGGMRVNIDPTRNVTYFGRACTFRIPGRAGTAGQKLFSIHNATGSAILVDVERITIDWVATVVKAVTVLPPSIRLYKVTVLPTNGTAVTKVARDSSLSSSSSVTILGDAASDGTNSGTALAATLPAGAVVTQIFSARLLTAVSYENMDAYAFLSQENEKITLRALEGLVVMLDYTLATQNPVTDFWSVDCKWTEYTIAT